MLLEGDGCGRFVLHPPLAQFFDYTAVVQEKSLILTFSSLQCVEKQEDKQDRDGWLLCWNKNLRDVRRPDDRQ
eukprot:scaffold3017_cov81-Cylindrotheca_fusiformis.AAC.5